MHFAERKLWKDCKGGIITIELLLVSSVIVAAVLAGLGTFKQTLTNEFNDLGRNVEAFESQSIVQPPVVAEQQEATTGAMEIYFPNEFIAKD